MDELMMRENPDRFQKSAAFPEQIVQGRCNPPRARSRMASPLDRFAVGLEQVLHTLAPASLPLLKRHAHVQHKFIFNRKPLGFTTMFAVLLVKLEFRRPLLHNFLSVGSGSV
jgi:hypothetical protein